MKQLIDDCKKGKQKARKELFHQYNRKFLGICLRYSSNKSEAEDILMEGFMQIYLKIDQYNFKGSFEGWMKTIIVHICIDYYRKNKKKNSHQNIDDFEDLPSNDYTILNEMSAKEILELIQTLPHGYRVVFNLFAIEGFSHKEIASKLQVTESTSKSQLQKARAWMVKRMGDYNY